MISLHEAITEAIEFAEQDGTALTPEGEEMIERWRNACMVDWQPIHTAPEDKHVILATTGGHVGEAVMLIDEDTGKQKWTWALGPLHPNHIPRAWLPMPKYEEAN